MSEALTDTPKDTGIVLTEIAVSTADLRQALRSVVVHASPDKDDPVLQRVRLLIQAGNVIVTATNRYTAALALVSIWDNTYADDDITIDLSSVQVAEILAMFKSRGEKGDDEGDDDLRLRLTDSYLIVTDVAGLFPGKEVTWPRLAVEENFPNLSVFMGAMLARAGTASSAQLHTSGRLLALFKTASAVYGRPIIIEPTSDEGGALVMSIGESFLGAIMPIRPSDEELAEQRTWREAWGTRLGTGQGTLTPGQMLLRRGYGLVTAGDDQ
jgi:hypothetical protein